MTDESAVPALAPSVKFRFDQTRQVWVILAPERLFLPDEQAVSVLQLVDGKTSLAGIIDTLAEGFDAPRAVIGGDVAAMLQDLRAKGVVRW
jgi:pyrroloquinoline quinone biosynthesis protein D